jgi:hypothetical protein
MIVVALGTMTTLLLGLKTSPIFDWQQQNYIAAVALVLSALIPIFSAWDAFFDYRWLWIRFATAQEALDRILNDMEYASKNGELSSQELDDFHQQFRSTLQETNSEWKAHRTSLEPSEAKGSEAG